jgi:hypothetical protein
MDEATAAAACVWCESSRRKRPNLRTATDITGTITSASTVQKVINKINEIEEKGGQNVDNLTARPVMFPSKIQLTIWSLHHKPPSKNKMPKF